MPDLMNKNLKYITFKNNSSIVVVKNGFSWTAFFFGFWVYLYRKMWGGFILWLFVGIIIITLSYWARAVAEMTGNADLTGFIFLIRIAYSIYQGGTINNNQMLLLKKQGYIETISAA
ncbi:MULTISPECIES: DUF2628 domain-containing protein [Gammaproteobacteria]|uniref:DUF2628 domain-containing protein n=1 Tax=Gammaproteobacteria TaxID=1236 RepID=UPI001D007746|nr:MULTISPECIES: DUF2628 domain-containing protein [Gammaproteobacteria]